MTVKSKITDGVPTIGALRYLKPDLPMMLPDGTISLEQKDGKFQIETIGGVVAAVLSRSDQGMSPLEAVCVTFICQQLYAGKDVLLTPDVAEVILKSFTNKLEQGVLSPIAFAIVTWVVRPEDENVLKYQVGPQELYDNLDVKVAKAKKRIAELEKQLEQARIVAQAQKASPQVN